MRILLALAVALCAFGCDDSGNPCTLCPNIAGSYAMALNDAAGSSSAGCATLGITDPTGPLVISQAAAGLSAQYGGFSLSGVLGATFHFTLSALRADGGSANSDSMNIQAAYDPNHADAGPWLSGTVSSQYQRTQAACSQVLPFTASPQ